MKKLCVLVHIRKDPDIEKSYVTEFRYSDHEDGFKRLADCDTEIQKLAAENNPFKGLDFKDLKRFKYFDNEKQEIVLGNLCDPARATMYRNLVAIDSFRITNMYDVEMALNDFKVSFGCNGDESGRVFIKVLNNDIEEYISDDDFSKYASYWETIMAKE